MTPKLRRWIALTWLKVLAVGVCLFFAIGIWELAQRKPFDAALLVGICVVIGSLFAAILNIGPDDA